MKHQPKLTRSRLIRTLGHIQYGITSALAAGVEHPGLDDAHEILVELELALDPVSPGSLPAIACDGDDDVPFAAGVAATTPNTDTKETTCMPTCKNNNRCHGGIRGEVRLREQPYEVRRQQKNNLTTLVSLVGHHEAIRIFNEVDDYEKQLAEARRYLMAKAGK